MARRKDNYVALLAELHEARELIDRLYAEVAHLRAENERLRRDHSDAAVRRPY